MSIPGFSAENSIYKALLHYRAAGSFNPSGSRYLVIGTALQDIVRPDPFNPSGFIIRDIGTLDSSGLFGSKWRDWCDSTCDSKRTVANLYCQEFGLGNSKSFNCPCTKGDYQAWKATGLSNVRATWECEGEMFPDDEQTEPIGL